VADESNCRNLRHEVEEIFFKVEEKFIGISCKMVRTSLDKVGSDEKLGDIEDLEMDSKKEQPSSTIIT